MIVRQVMSWTVIVNFGKAHPLLDENAKFFILAEFVSEMMDDFGGKLLGGMINPETWDVTFTFDSHLAAETFVDAHEDAWRRHRREDNARNN